MHVVANIDKATNQAYLFGYFQCSQINTPRSVRFYIYSGSTKTTLLSIDCVRLNLKWHNLKRTYCDTAIGPAEPYVLAKSTIFLKTIDKQIEKLTPYKLEAVNLLPPEDPCEVYPAQYEFGFSLLGMDILKEFKTWK